MYKAMELPADYVMFVTEIEAIPQAINYQIKRQYI